MLLIYISNFFDDIDFANPAIQDGRFHVSSRPNVFRKNRREFLFQRFGEQITRGMVEANLSSVFAPDTSVFSELTGKFGGEPTTGLMGLLLALDTLAPILKHVYVTGFSFFEGKSHYFSGQTVQPFHNLNDERELICQRLREEAALGRVSCDPILSERLGLDENEFRRIAI